MKVSRLAAHLVAVLGFSISLAANAQTVLKVGWTNTIDSHYGIAMTTFGDEIDYDREVVVDPFTTTGSAGRRV